MIRLVCRSFEPFWIYMSLNFRHFGKILAKIYIHIIMMCIQYKKSSKNISVIFNKYTTQQENAADCGIFLSFHPL